MHSDFSSSRLVRLAGAWTPAPPATGMDFAERLGLWLNAFDAIKLQGAQQALGAPAAVASPSPRLKAAVRALQEQLQRVRAALAHAIAQDPVALAGADPQAPGWAPFQRRHGELQRHMEQMLVPLREQARLTLAEASPRLRQLAALDALMQQVLAPREQGLLATLPGLLAQRFAQVQVRPEPVRPVQQLALATEGEPATSAEDPSLGAPQGLPVFTEEWRLALLAELDLRLEPVVGLLAALNNEVNLSP